MILLLAGNGLARLESGFSREMRIVSGSPCTSAAQDHRRADCNQQLPNLSSAHFKLSSI